MFRVTVWESVDMRIVCIVLIAFSLIACGTTDSELTSKGASHDYILGFHDGRHSGIKEAGNHWDHYVRDEQKFSNNKDYRDGWLAGEAEGKELQKQAVTVGVAAAVASEAISVKGEMVDLDKVAQEAAKK
ncbi:hypothetical protein K0504_02230 [Neiella marina]|uniref:Lipoprotein n=1 Tax=Neiella holothuriorum TaxID=2870530 RepID=A0ABS7ECA4_9GAMM|nr:hypothetical protein [Neiella holothuriorum]MBW8189839.1 hypothetical protein [Neiella holothuriorum]